MKRMFPTASMLVTYIIDQALKESLNYFVVVTKAYQLKKKYKGKREIIICVPAAFWLRLYLLNKYNYNSLFHNTRFTIDEAKSKK